MDIGIYIQPVCSLISQRQLSTWVYIYNQNFLWYHKDSNRHGYLYTTSMFFDITKTIIDMGMYYNQHVLWYREDINRHGYLYTTSMFCDTIKKIIDMGTIYNRNVLWYHKDNNRHGYLYTTSMFSDIIKKIIDMGIYIQPVCSLISQRQ